MCWGLFSLTSHFKGLGEATEAHQRNSNFPFSSIVLTALQCISLQQFVCKRDRVQLTSSIASVELWWKIAPRVLFFLPKQTRMRPSHSLKLTGGGGFLGSMRTTLLSTLGGGLKLFLPTCMAGHTYHQEIQQASECTDRSIPAATANLSSAQGDWSHIWPHRSPTRQQAPSCCDFRHHASKANISSSTGYWSHSSTLSRWETRARSCVFTASLQYKLSPGLATRRMANSCWNMMTAARKPGR